MTDKPLADAIQWATDEVIGMKVTDPAFVHLSHLLIAAAARAQVPREPTEAMMQAAYEDWNNHNGCGKPRSAAEGMRARWRAMYDAALSPSESSEGAVEPAETALSAQPAEPKQPASKLIAAIDPLYRDMMNAGPGDCASSDLEYEAFAMFVGEHWPEIRAAIDAAPPAAEPKQEPRPMYGGVYEPWPVAEPKLIDYLDDAGIWHRGKVYDFPADAAAEPKDEQKDAAVAPQMNSECTGINERSIGRVTESDKSRHRIPRANPDLLPPPGMRYVSQEEVELSLRERLAVMETERDRAVEALRILSDTLTVYAQTDALPRPGGPTEPPK